MNPLKKLPVSDAIVLWDDFISHFSTPVPFSFNPSLFHFYTKHFRWKPYYFLIYENDALCTIFPIVDTGKACVSLPHFSYGGFVFKTSCEKRISNHLIHGLLSEIRSKKRSPGFYRYDLEDKSLPENTISTKLFIRSLSRLSNDVFIESEKLTSLMTLPNSKDDLASELSVNLKRKIRKAKNSGLRIRSGNAELLDDFYKVYSANIYKLQSLNYSKAFFRDFLATYTFGDLVFFVAYQNDVPVGSGLLASYHGFFENLYFASKAASRKHYVSDLLHYEMINFSMSKSQAGPINAEKSNGSVNRPPVYSFGRSTRSSGVHAYKSHWPIKDYPIYIFSNMLNVRKHKWLQKLWGLLPHGISQPIGGHLIKHIY